MKKRNIALLILLTAALGAGAAYKSGLLPEKLTGLLAEHLGGGNAATPGSAKHKTEASPIAPAVTVAKATIMPLVETTLVTGTLVPRDEILVAPEVDGLRVVELHADAGDRVQRGQLLATLEKATLEAQLAQSTASLARAEAAIAQARSQILQAEAAAKEAAAAFDRAKPLNKDGIVSDAVRDQREAAARTTAAQLVAARDGLKVAEAAKAEFEAQHSNLLWRLDKAEVKAPRAGIVSRRTARIGGLSSAAAQPEFRILPEGPNGLDAEATESRLARIKVDQKAVVEIAGVGNVEGTVRLVSPEVDRLTRLGSVRILIGDDPGLRIGAFGRGRIVSARTRGIAVPASAVLFGSDGAATVQRVVDGKVVVVTIRTGLRTEGSVEVTSGLDEGAVVVAKAGTFLRNGDLVRPVLPDERISAARPAHHDRSGAQTVDVGQ